MKAWDPVHIKSHGYYYLNGFYMGKNGWGDVEVYVEYDPPEHGITMDTYKDNNFWWGYKTTLLSDETLVKGWNNGTEDEKKG